MPTKTLAVYAIPYLHIDHEGRPAGAVPTDPDHTGGERRWVGARLDTERTKVTGQSPDLSLHEHAQDTVFAFDDEPVRLPRTQYYIQRLQSGELAPADAPTALAAGVKFEPKIADLRAKARADAAARWKAQHGEDLPGDAPPPKSAPATKTKAATASEE